MGVGGDGVKVMLIKIKVLWGFVYRPILFLMNIVHVSVEVTLHPPPPPFRTQDINLEGPIAQKLSGDQTLGWLFQPFLFFYGKANGKIMLYWSFQILAEVFLWSFIKIKIIIPSIYLGLVIGECVL